jgi:hypothetical protein
MKTLGWLVIALLGLAVMIGLLFGVVFYAMRQSGAFEMAHARIVADARVHEVVGTPVEIGWLISGHVKIRNDDGRAELSLPVQGPSGEDQVEVEATLHDGRWRLDELKLYRGAGEPVDLLPPP